MARECVGGGCGSKSLCAVMGIYVATMFSCQQRVLFVSAEPVEREGAAAQPRCLGGSSDPLTTNLARPATPGTLRSRVFAVGERDKLENLAG